VLTSNKLWCQVNSLKNIQSTSKGPSLSISKGTYWFPLESDNRDSDRDNYIDDLQLI